MRETDARRLKHTELTELRKRGEEHANAILTDAIITEIRTLCLSMSQSAVGRNFGISQSHVSQIVNRKIWAHV